VTIPEREAELYVWVELGTLDRALPLVSHVGLSRCSLLFKLFKPVRLGVSGVPALSNSLSPWRFRLGAGNLDCFRAVGRYTCSIWSWAKAGISHGSRSRMPVGRLAAQAATSGSIRVRWAVIWAWPSSVEV
jgi:hypothetical protein